MKHPARRWKPMVIILATLTLIGLPTNLGAESETAAEVCEGFGPQTPRDIDDQEGANPRKFSLAPSYSSMNLCNIHFHKNAEHKARDFSLRAEDGEYGGYRCRMSADLSQAELLSVEKNHCHGVQPGDTIEVHWVYTSCGGNPGPSLGSCLSDRCSNPTFRVEAQVFVMVNDPSTLDFGAMAYGGYQSRGFHQAKSLPTNTGLPVEFLGSTTGPTFTERECSPFQVTWRVRPLCAKLDISGLSEWCQENVFDEDHAHGVRGLVTNPYLLSEIE